MKLYLDTNMVTYFLFNRDELACNVREMLFDYSNLLFASSVCVHELIHLCQIGKVLKESKGKGIRIDSQAIIKSMGDAGIGLVPVNERHLSVYASLPLLENHKDPNDRLIIAQAISDRTTLLSSDRKFEQYQEFGLDFVFNER